MTEIKHYDIRVIGKVQGVFFRASTKEVAVDLGITGWVRNEDDGSVKIQAEGTDEQLSEFLKYCKSGPKNSLVEEVKISSGDVHFFEKFEIIRKS